MRTAIAFRRALLVFTCGTAIALVPSTAAGQGCEPIRFTVPVNLGALGQAYKPSGWELSLAYRRLYSEDWFVGRDQDDARAPAGQPPVFEIHTLVGEVSYKFNDRFRARLDVPFSTGSLTRIWPDGQTHEQTATGLGDISLIGEAWLLKPRTHPRGNISLGLGFKAPTGNHKIGSQFYTASGPKDFPADQTIQPSDGGWGVLMDMQAFGQIFDRTSLYAIASYMANPKAKSDVPGDPSATAPYWSVPDVYSGRTGVAYDLFPEHGLSVSLGARIDGIPVHDVFGGVDDSTTIRRSAYVVFADPGMSYSRDKNTFTLSVPWRVKVNRMKSVREEQTGGLNAGGFAKYLIFASYSRRI